MHPHSQPVYIHGHIAGNTCTRLCESSYNWGSWLFFSKIIQLYSLINRDTPSGDL